MKRVYLSFVWSLHQPFFTDSTDKRYYLPDVFLSAIGHYYDILFTASKHAAKCTYCLSPSLLVQLEELSADPAKDRLLYVLSKEPASLTERERVYLVNALFDVNYEAVVMPFTRYRELFNTRLGGGELSDRELLDLEVLFLLAHTGDYLRKNDDAVRLLLEKQAGYSQDDKEMLIYHLGTFLKETLDFYRKMKEENQACIITTAFYYPVLPLLENVENAKVAHDGLKVPALNTDFADDGKAQVDEAVKLHKRVFGSRPHGFLPPEGALSRRALEWIDEAGFVYSLADESSLLKVTGFDLRESIYKPYEFNSLKLLFVDRKISRDVGFKYPGLSIDLAVDDFVSRLRHIYDASSFDPVVTVVVDAKRLGNYHGNGENEFFAKLYDRLVQLDWIDMVTPDEAIHSFSGSTYVLSDLAPGSFCNGNLNRWVGTLRKNRAWEMLDRAHMDCDTNSQDVRNELMISESSYWFNHYDDETKATPECRYDALFRKHIINAYRFSSLKPPWSVFEPICKPAQHAFLLESSIPVMPRIDGRLTGAFEWMEALLLKPVPARIFHLMRTTFDEKFTYIALFGELDELPSDAQLEFDFPQRRIFNVRVPAENSSETWYRVARDDFIEIRITRKIEFDYVILRIISAGKPREELFFIRSGMQMPELEL